MIVAVLGARGSVGRVCVDELAFRGIKVSQLHRGDVIPEGVNGIIVTAPIKICEFDGPLVDCSGSLQGTSISLPPIRTTYEKRKRVPNCMASLITQALAPLHNECKIISILATTMQSVSGAGWRGVEALKQSNTSDLFGGDLTNNILPHEKYEQEEGAIKNDLKELFDCDVTVTSFRVPVFTGHVASLRVITKKHVKSTLLQESNSFDPKSMENKREIAIGRVRVNQNTTDLVVCGDQILCGAVIPAVESIISS